MKTYNLALDIERIISLYELTIEDFSSEIGLSRMQLYNLINGNDSPSLPTLEKIYGYIYNRGFNFNRSKESFFIDNALGRKTLFHGCKNEIVGEVDIYHSLPPNDFGDGFYLGESLAQAATWVAGNQKASVYCFYFKSDDLQKMKFDVDRTWLYVVMYYRGAFTNFELTSDILAIVERIEKVDYLIAPIADNEMFKTIDSFIRNEITDEACLHALSATNLGLQYVFKSQKACDSLEFIDRLYLCEKEKEDYLSLKAKNTKEGIEKAQLAKVEYRRTGKYFDELFKRKR